MASDEGLSLFGEEKEGEDCEVDGATGSATVRGAFKNKVGKVIMMISYDDDDDYHLRANPREEGRRGSQPYAALPRKLVQNQEDEKMQRGKGRCKEEQQKWSKLLTSWEILLTK